MIDFPEDMTARQRTAMLLELLEGNARLPISIAAQRLGVSRRGIYSIVNCISVVRPDVQIENGEIFRKELE